ncbi:MAG TPA: poly(R)-hydroxyalkanoic acid synthase subunit PhaE [Methylomirabilota bacterium]|nr:poly(R)-hydroxyalkanoic acid synthase subunit PhaE [Methylomirabilota bacterium]
MADNTSQHLLDMWKRQVEEGTQAWLRMMGQAPAAAAPPMDPQAFWRPFMDQGMAAWSKVMTQGSAPSPDLMAQWKQFLDQWIAAWSRVLEQAMGTDTFAKMMGKQLEGFLNVSGPVKKAAEQQIDASLAGLGMPSRAQVVALARHLAQVEEKIDGLEDKLDRALRGLDAGAGGRERA